MLKKFFCAMFMLTAILFVDSTKVSAQDVWIHTDGKSGTDYYVVTETFNNRAPNSIQISFSINVKYVRGNSLIAEKTYSFEGHDMVSYSVDGVDKGSIFNFEKSRREEPANSILGYVMRNFGVTNGMGEH